VLKQKESSKTLFTCIFRPIGEHDIREAASHKGRYACSKNIQKKRLYIIRQLSADGFSIADIAAKLNLSRKSVYMIVSANE
jgi:DNA-binding NarL/FixJ family response regulator